jgi:predicted transcriptional regulator
MTPDAYRPNGICQRHPMVAADDAATRSKLDEGKRTWTEGSGSAAAAEAWA